jgi:hypothetical protein
MGVLNKWQYKKIQTKLAWIYDQYEPKEEEILVDHAESGIYRSRNIPLA